MVNSLLCEVLVAKVRNRANDAYLILHRIVQLVVVANDAILRLH